MSYNREWDRGKQSDAWNEGGNWNDGGARGYVRGRDEEDYYYGGGEGKRRKYNNNDVSQQVLVEDDTDTRTKTDRDTRHPDLRHMVKVTTLTLALMAAVAATIQTIGILMRSVLNNNVVAAVFSRIKISSRNDLYRANPAHMSSS